MRHHLYVGTFRLRGESAGIHVLDFDASTGAVQGRSLARLANASYLAVSSRHATLYAAVHTAMFEGEPGGALVAFAIDATSGGLTRRNHRIFPFPHPNYVSLDMEERSVLTTAGLGGGVGVFPIAADGSLAPATAAMHADGEPMLRLGETLLALGGQEFVRRRALSTSPHAVIVDPSGRFAVVMDAGPDRLLLYELDDGGGLTMRRTLAVRNAGAAPRHAAFHPDGTRLYVVNEEQSSVTVFAFDPVAAVLVEKGTVSALPPGRNGMNAMGDVKIDATGHRLYCTNRGDDSIAVFAIAEGGDDLELIEATDCGGVHPRGLGFSPDGRFLLVANQGPGWHPDATPQPGSARAGVVVFAVDAKTGRLSPTGYSSPINDATCIAFGGSAAPASERSV